MKKNIIGIILSLTMVIVCAFALVACGEQNEQDGSSGGPRKYTVTVESTDDCELIADKTSVEGLETVTVTVNLKNPDKKLVGVKCGTSNASKQSDNTYTFTMLYEDVTVYAVLEDYEEQLAGGPSSVKFMVFDSENTKTVSKKEGEFSMYISMSTASYMSILNWEITSSNQDVIPDDAFSIEKQYKSMSNIIIGAYVNVDTTKVNNGYAWITIDFKNGNVSSQYGTIVVKLTVVD